MKSWQAHYLNKYPGGHVEASDQSFRVYDAAGKLRVAMQKDDSGMKDVSEEMGLADRHDLAPIPKDSRIHKVIGGKIVRDDKADEREKLKDKFVKNGKVLSCAELSAKEGGYGFEFDEKQRLEKEGEVK